MGLGMLPVVALGGPAIEYFFGGALNFGVSSVLGLPKAYSAVVLCNAVFPTLTLIYLAFGIVSKARKKSKVEYPVMHPTFEKEGDDNYLFLCAQRAHQQALEWYGSFVILSLFGGLTMPLSTAFAGLLWSIARVEYGKGYAKSPSERYSSKFGVHVWSSLLLVLVTASITALKIAF